MKVGIKFFGSVAKLNNLGTNKKNKNNTYEEFKSRFNSTNSYCNAAQNFLSFRIISKYIKIKMRRNLISSVVYMGVELRFAL
jgi:hypothetical protein